MSFGISMLLPRRDDMKIAQRFNVGSRDGKFRSPGGTAEAQVGDPTFCRPSGTRFASHLHPALKRWATVVRPPGTRFLSLGSPEATGTNLAFKSHDAKTLDDYCLPGPVGLRAHGVCSAYQFVEMVFVHGYRGNLWRTHRRPVEGIQRQIVTNL